MRFIIENSRFLGFGLAVAFMSSFGQTYFIGVYRPAIVADYGLSNSEFGAYYLIITIGSAIGLNRFGHIIDSVRLQPYALSLVLLTAAACACVMLAPGFWPLVAALLFVRLMGQGMLVHASTTSMSRYYVRRRGMAVAVAGLGMPIGQALLPPLAVALMGVYDWQTTWLFYGSGLLFVGAPMVLWLLRGHDTRHQKWREEEQAAGEAANAGGNHKRRGDVLRDVRFYLMLPALIAGPFWITAAFFFASDIAAFKMVSIADFTLSYGYYALGSVAAPFVGGALVDRFGGLKLMPLYAPIFGLALFVMLPDLGGLDIMLFMALLGLGAGISWPINNAVWAELYGTKYLGEVKSLATSIVVVSTALAPFIVGLLLDFGVALAAILVGGGLYCFAATVLLAFALTRAR